MSFWKPGTAEPGSSADRQSEEQAVGAIFNAGAHLSLADQRKRLPIAKSSMLPSNTRTANTLPC